MRCSAAGQTRLADAVRSSARSRLVFLLVGERALPVLGALPRRSPAPRASGSSARVHEAEACLPDTDGRARRDTISDDVRKLS